MCELTAEEYAGIQPIMGADSGRTPGRGNGACTAPRGRGMHVRKPAWLQNEEDLGNWATAGILVRNDIPSKE